MRAAAIVAGFLFVAFAFAVTALWTTIPTERPAPYITVTPGAPHLICLRIEGQVIPDTCRTVFGEPTVSVRIITATP